MTWKRTRLRAVILRIQGSVFISHRCRRHMLNFCGASIDPTAIVRHSCWLASADIFMGPGTVLNCFAYYDGGARLQIFKGARVGAHANFTTWTHPISDDLWRRASAQDIREPIKIGVGCWVGTRVTIMPEVSIAPGCVIAAGSVVTERTRPHGVYAGVPAVRKKDLPV